MESKTKTDLILPFNGTWNVTNGGRSPETNNHCNTEKSPKSMFFAYDFRLEHIGTGEKLEDYEVFGKDVISPANGKVIQVINGAIDVLPGERDRGNGIGNAIIIDFENGEFGVICHLKHDSIRVSVGNNIKQGQIIGLCGNTGNTTEPHIHFQLQDGPFMHNSNALPAQFRNIFVNGEVRKNYELTRGEKVSNIKYY
jgi:hypothetical protein